MAVAILRCARHWTYWPRADIPADYLRIRGFPFHASVEAFIREHEFCYVVEQNRDAQLRALLLLETDAPKERLRSLLVYGGFPLSARHVVDHILNSNGEVNSAIDSQTDSETSQPSTE